MYHLRSGLEMKIKMLGRFSLGTKCVRDGAFKPASLSRKDLSVVEIKRYELIDAFIFNLHISHNAPSPKYRN